MNSLIGAKGRAAGRYYVQNKLRRFSDVDVEEVTGTTIPITALTISGRNLAAS
jgi:hypothetical protein